MNTGSTPKRVEAIRRAKRMHMRQSWQLRGGVHDWGFKRKKHRGQYIRVPNPEERALMQFCLKRWEEGATIRCICDEVEARLAAFEGRKPLAFGFQKLSWDRCRRAITRECLLQGEEAADRELVEILDGYGRSPHTAHLYSVPTDVADEVRKRHREEALRRAAQRHSLPVPVAL
ncbi:MAG TPA: hypothetical protein VHC22_13370 [Pirellulales bacterium]|nr:hypothetical protein [Pirellulales bacterium]